MKTAVRLGLVACLALLAMPMRAEEKVDTSDVVVKKAIADTMTPEQLLAYKERIARNLAARRQTRALPRIPGPETPGDTCPAATPEVGTLPYTPPADTTVGATDDYNITGNPTNPSTPCVGDGLVPGGRGTTYLGTGVGPDRAYHLKTDANCVLTITMTPTSTDDLALMVFQPTCADSGANALCIDDTHFGGEPETVVLTAVAGTDYFVVVDGYSTGAVAPGPAGPFTLSITGTGCQLVGGASAVGVYHTLTPCRIIDTRNSVGTYGGPALSAGIDRSFDLDAGACGVPATADSVFLNVTVVNPSATGNLRIWPTGTAAPTVSALNYAAGQTRGNNGIFKVSATGSIDIRATQASGTVDVIVDVAGYFEE